MSVDGDLTSLSKGKSPSVVSVNGTGKRAEDTIKAKSRWQRATRGTKSFLFGRVKEVTDGDSNHSEDANHKGEGNSSPDIRENKKSIAELGRSKSVWTEHVWSTFIHRACSDEGEEHLEKGSELITEFQRAKFRHFFYHVLDLNSDHVISQEDFDGLNARVRHYMDWSSNCIHYLSLREVHSLFLEHFLTSSTKIASQTFDYCDPFRSMATSADNQSKNNKAKECVTIDEWVDVWGLTVGKARKMDDLPMWLQYYPKTLFDTINRSGTGEATKKELKLFYTAFMDAGRLGDRALDEQTEQAYSALTSGGNIPLTFHVYKLSFLNFLIGKQPNGPGQFIFGKVHAKKDVSSMFPIDYSALNSTNEERETYSPAKLEEKGNRKSVIV